MKFLTIYSLVALASALSVSVVEFAATAARAPPRRAATTARAPASRAPRAGQTGGRNPVRAATAPAQGAVVEQKAKPRGIIRNQRGPAKAPNAKTPIKKSAPVFKPPSIPRSNRGVVQKAPRLRPGMTVLAGVFVGLTVYSIIELNQSLEYWQLNRIAPEKTGIADGVSDLEQSEWQCQEFGMPEEPSNFFIRPRIECNGEIVEQFSCGSDQFYDAGVDGVLANYCTAEDVMMTALDGEKCERKQPGGFKLISEDSEICVYKQKK